MSQERKRQESTESDVSDERGVDGIVDGGLPISQFKKEIVELVRENLFCIITGETGSGKSTQIAQFMADGIGEMLDEMDEDKFRV